MASFDLAQAACSECFESNAMRTPAKILHSAFDRRAFTTRHSALDGAKKLLIGILRSEKSLLVGFRLSTVRSEEKI